MSGLKALADSIAKSLVARGFTVHRYDATRTDSVYLRLDYGACNSIRVGDHPGHQHVKYRYNIGPWIETYMETEDTYPRFYWPESEADELVAKCVADRDTRVSWSGDGGYAQIVERKRKEAKKAKTGFWTHARKVRG